MQPLRHTLSADPQSRHPGWPELKVRDASWLLTLPGSSESLEGTPVVSGVLGKIRKVNKIL